jgi:phage gpG-like protein
LVIGSEATVTGLDTGLRFWSREQSAAVGRRIVDRIRERSLRGIGADGVPFRPYSPDYDRADTARPDLRDTGRLLGALQVIEATEAGALVEAPGVPYAAAVDARRPFMGLAPDDARDLDELVDQLVDEANR